MIIYRLESAPGGFLLLLAFHYVDDSEKRRRQHYSAFKRRTLCQLALYPDQIAPERVFILHCVKYTTPQQNRLHGIVAAFNAKQSLRQHATNAKTAKSYILRIRRFSFFGFRLRLRSKAAGAGVCPGGGLIVAR